MELLIIVLVIAIIIGVWGIHSSPWCPECGSMLDLNYHGYNREYGHCDNCGYCTYDIKYNGGK